MTLTATELTPKAAVASWLCQIVAAAILAQTLFFKFTGAEESVYIFTAIGAEPCGRIGSGVAELVAAILLVTPRGAWIGALMSMGLMVGAIGAHLTKLGLEVKGDGGLLFCLALTVLVAGAIVALLRLRQIPVVDAILAPGRS